MTGYCIKRKSDNNLLVHTVLQRRNDCKGLFLRLFSDVYSDWKQASKFYTICRVEILEITKQKFN